MFYSMLVELESLFKKNCWLLLWLFASGPGFSQSSLKDYKHKGAKLKQSYPDYDQCKKLAFEKYQNQSPSSKFTRSMFIRELEICKEMHPASFSFRQCKKSILEEIKSKANSLDRSEIKGKLQQCKTQMSERIFPGKNPVPVWKDIPTNQIFFAGLGLNDLVPVTSLRKKGFDCAPVQRAKEENLPANYWFFPFRFTDEIFERWVPQYLKEKKAQNVEQIEKKLWDKNNPIGNQFLETDSKKVAALYLDKNSSKKNLGELNVYYGSFPCNFAFDVGSVFKAASVFYLLNPERTQALPYFGVVFYETESTEEIQSALEIANQLQKKLGEDFTQSLNPGKDLHIIANKPIQQFTSEGDPSNLCSKKPGTESSFLGVVKPENPESKNSKAKYLMLVNVKNLCEYNELHRKALQSKN